MIRDDLAVDLRAWLGEKLGVLQAEARRNGEPIPSRLPADARLFTVPKELVKILIETRSSPASRRPTTAADHRRSRPANDLRHALEQGGNYTATAQAAMRHSDIDLTVNVYTDPRLLDMRGLSTCFPRCR